MVLLNITPKSMGYEGFRIQQLINLSHKAPWYGKLLPGKYQSTSKIKTASKEKYTYILYALKQY
jgi:hypothetical protein